MNTSFQSLFSHFTYIDSILKNNIDDAVKTRALDIGLRTLSDFVESLDVPTDLQASWSDVTNAWKMTKSDEERCSLAHQIGTLLRKVSSVVTPFMSSNATDELSDASSLFQKNAQALQGVLVHLKNLLATFKQSERRNSTKMTLMRVLDGTVSHTLSGLDGQTEIANRWKQLIAEMHKAKSETEQTAFVDTACTELSDLIDMAGKECALLERLHFMVDAPKKEEDDLSLWQQQEVKTLLARSLSEPAQRERNELSYTFQAVDSLILHILNGDYGKKIREHLLLNGFFAQEHLLVLLLVDCIRSGRPIQSVEIFRMTAPEDRNMLHEIRIDNETLFHWISTDNAALPKLFTKIASRARFDDEKQFAYLRESARLHYAPSPKSLLYLILHAKTEKILQAIKPLVEKKVYATLQKAYDVISLQDTHLVATALNEALEEIDDEDTRREWLDMVIMGVAHDRGPLAIQLAHAFVDEYELEDMLRDIVIVYAEEHPEEAEALFPQFTREERQSILYSIAAFHAQHRPQVALTYIDELADRMAAGEILALMARHQLENFGLEGSMKTSELVSEQRKPAFYASIAIELAKEIGMESAYQAILPHVGEAREAFVMAIASQTERSMHLATSFSTLVQAVGDRHQDAVRAGLLRVREFSAQNSSEITDEEIDMFEAISDNTLLGNALIEYLTYATTWPMHELDQVRATEYQRKVMRLLPLVQRVHDAALHDKLQSLLPFLVVAVDTGLAISSIAKINDPALKKAAINDVVDELLNRILDVTNRDLRLATGEEGMVSIPADVHELPAYLDTLYQLVTQCAGDDTAFLARVQMRFISLWAPFSSEKALSLFETLPTHNQERWNTALANMALGHFSRYNTAPGNIDHFLALFPDPELHPADPAYAILSSLLLHKGDLERTIAVISRIQDIRVKVACCARAIQRWCMQGIFDEHAVDLLMSARFDPKLQHEVLDIVMHLLDTYMSRVLKEEEQADLRAKIEGIPLTPTRGTLRPLAASLDPLHRLIEAWAAEDRRSWHQRLVWLYAPFCSTKALKLLESATIEDAPLSRKLLQHIAYNSLSPYNTTGKQELDTILGQLEEEMSAHAEPIAIIACKLITHNEMMERALAALQKLLKNPSVPINGLYAQVLADCFQILAANHPEQCLDLLNEVRDPLFCAHILTTGIIPELFHSGRLHEGHADPICLLAKTCDPHDADTIYGALAFAYAKEHEDLACALVGMIRSRDAKQAWADHIDHIFTYKELYPKQSARSEIEQAAFAIEIAPYLRKEALEIIKRIPSSSLALYTLRKILQGAIDNKTANTLRHYAADIEEIKQRS